MCHKLVEVVNKSSHLTITKGSSSNGYVGYNALWAYNSNDTFAGTNLTTDSNGYITFTEGNDKVLIGYTVSETNLTLPSDITKINQYAFYNCKSIRSVTIGDSVESVDKMAFCDCFSLTRITFTDTSTWYITTSQTNGKNKEKGTEMDVTSPITNADNFKSTYDDYYWYKV